MLPPALRFLGPRRKDYLPGLLDHYQPISRGMVLLDEALRRHLKVSPDRGFQVLVTEIDTLEAEADKIKRRIRNHLPSAFLMVVDKTLLLNYTRSQDDILDAVQEAASWLAVQELARPGDLDQTLPAYVAEARRTVEMLRPALAAVIDILLSNGPDRTETKECIHAIRLQHLKVAKAKRALVGATFATDLDFRHAYQILRFVKFVHQASHGAEACADTLRAMLAR